MSLFRFGTKEHFARQRAGSPLLQKLWSVHSSETVNAPATLPPPVASRSEIFEAVAQDTGRWPLKVRQGAAYAKALARFYRQGVTQVWRNNKHARELVRTHWLPHVDSKGAEHRIRIPSFDALARHMAQRLYMDRIETQTEAAAHEGAIRDTSNPRDVLLANMFTLTRAEFQTLRRTPADFIRIPTFAVLATIFMEMTPALCYFVPEVTPSTCVLPLVLPRIWRPQAKAHLELLVQPDSPEDYALKTAYNLPVAHVRALCAVLRLTSRYVPFYPESVLRRRLQQHLLYIMADNYYLSGRNGGGNLWALSPQETVLAALERGLVEDVSKVEIPTLKLRLLRFIVDMETSNVGYFALAHLLEDVSGSGLAPPRSTHQK